MGLTIHTNQTQKAIYPRGNSITAQIASGFYPVYLDAGEVSTTFPLYTWRQERSALPSPCIPGGWRGQQYLLLVYLAAGEVSTTFNLNTWRMERSALPSTCLPGCWRGQHYLPLVYLEAG